MSKTKSSQRMTETLSPDVDIPQPPADEQSVAMDAIGDPVKGNWKMDVTRTRVKAEL